MWAGMGRYGERSSVLISRTMPTIRLNAVFFAPSSRHAVPMQKRVEPAILARRAASSTSSFCIMGVAFTLVLCRVDCAQYLQSS